MTYAKWLCDVAANLNTSNTALAGAVKEGELRRLFNINMSPEKAAQMLLRTM